MLISLALYLQCAVTRRFGHLPCPIGLLCLFAFPSDTATPSVYAFLVTRGCAAPGEFSFIGACLGSPLFFPSFLLSFVLSLSLMLRFFLQDKGDVCPERRSVRHVVFPVSLLLAASFLSASVFFLSNKQP